jgi:hypothetical protein
MGKTTELGDGAIRMPNTQIRMTNECPTPNDQEQEVHWSFVSGHWGLIGHSDLGIGHSSRLSEPTPSLRQWDRNDHLDIRARGP